MQNEISNVIAKRVGRVKKKNLYHTTHVPVFVVIARVMIHVK
jgi:hypothetical protein